MVRGLPHDSVSVQLVSKGGSVEKSGVVVAFARLCNLIAETLHAYCYCLSEIGCRPPEVTNSIKYK